MAPLRPPGPQGLERHIELLTEALRRGDAPRRLEVAEGESPDPLHLSLHRLIEAAGAVTAHQTTPERPNDVQLALEELAREQAERLSRQNEELRRQNEALRSANRLRGEFLATLSHELRTPLTSVMGYSELLLHGVCGELQEQQAEHIRTIHQAGASLLMLLNDVLDLAKVDAGQMRYQSCEFDLRGPVGEAEQLARPLARKKELELQILAPDLVPAFGDPHRVRQVVLNLMSNAVKFTPPGGRVTVSVRAAGDAAELVVEDSGIGIDPVHHALVFEPFRQVEGANTGGRGTGLGLALVKKFVEAMGGTVGLQSEPGRGATFSVRLPGGTGRASAHGRDA